MDVILKEGIDLLNEIGAKQSTSEEIKNTSQEILANIKDLNPSVDGKIVKTTGAVSCARSSNTTVLNVTGKGTFDGCVITNVSMAANKSVDIVVTIDGVTFFARITAANISGSTSGCLSFIEAKHINTFLYSTSGGDYRREIKGIAISTGGTGVTLVNEGESAPEVSTGKFCAICEMGSPLPFEKSLKVQFKNTNGNGAPTAYAWYTLDE